MNRFIHFIIGFATLLMFSCADAADRNPSDVLGRTWVHYKKTFIRQGRVVRPENGDDTVSEGQAYAMLRAVLMGDRATFDECLAWTESNLSRQAAFGDRLLMWHFEKGLVTGTASASDADIDYAASLVLAYQKWRAPRYLQIARCVTGDILQHETVSVGGRLYLAPWPVTPADAGQPLHQNISYYSPAQFRLFYKITGDSRWIDLVDTSYYLIEKVQQSFDGMAGGGVVPDWCTVMPDGKVVPMPGKPPVYGWDAVRVPLRIGADWLVNRDPRASRVLKRFARFFDRAYGSSRKICSTYHYCCAAVDHRENPVFYAAAFAAAKAAGQSRATEYLNRMRSFLRQDGEDCYYHAPADYYINSLCWLPDYCLYFEQLQQKP